DLDSIDLDSDHDGLPDLVERRIHTDPLKTDSDDDGEPDSSDLSPNSHGRPVNEQQEITAAIFKQYFAFSDQKDSDEVSLAIVISDFALDWQGWNGPVITLSKQMDEAFLQEAGYDGVPHITISPEKAPAHSGGGLAAYTTTELPEGFQLKAGERVYNLTI